MTLYDALIIYGKLTDIFNIKFEELINDLSKLAISASGEEETTLLPASEVSIPSEIKLLMIKRVLVKLTLEKHMTQFIESKATDPFSYLIDNEKEVKSLQNIFKPEVENALIRNRFIQAAFMLREAVSEILINEKQFVANCEGIEFDQLNLILQKHEQAPITTEDLLAINNLAKNIILFPIHYK